MHTYQAHKKSAPSLESSAPCPSDGDPGRLYKHKYVYTYIHIYIYVYVCIYMYICIYIHTHTYYCNNNIIIIHYIKERPLSRAPPLPIRWRSSSSSPLCYY